MRTLLMLLSAAAVIAAMGTAQAQNAGAVVPQVTAPETVRPMVQGTSDAATKPLPAAPADKKDVKPEMPKAPDTKK